MMTHRKNLLLTFTAIALLAGCDDSSSQNTSWIDWLTGKDNETSVIAANDGAMLGFYSRETQAGNYLAGQFAQYRQDWKTANIYLDKAMLLDPGNIDLQQRSMILAMQAGDWTRGLTLARKVLEEDNKNLLALLFVGVDQISQQEYSKAENTFKKMPASGVADFIKPILMAWSQSPNEKVDTEFLATSGPLHAFHALLIADYLGKVEDPNRFFVNVLAGGGADKHMLEMMGDVYARQGDKDLALKIYDTLLTEAEKDNLMNSRYFILKEKRDNFGLAAKSKITSPAQGAAELFYNMARILFQDQSNDSALVFARLSSQLDPAKDDARLLIAGMMVQAGHIDDAIALYKSIKTDSPGYAEAQRSAAELLEKEGKLEDSIALLEENYKNTKDVENIVQIGDVYRRAEQHDKAIKAYDRAIDAMGGKVSSDHWVILYARGMSYEQLGNSKKAEEDLMAALEFQPDHPYLLNYLGYSWADQGKKLNESLEMIQKAVTLKPDDGYIVDSLGWVYYKVGRYDEAVAELERAVELVPYDPIINDHLGDAYWNVGRKNEARFQWARALNHSKDSVDISKLQEKIDIGLVKADKPLKEAASKAPPAKQTIKQ